MFYPVTVLLVIAGLKPGPLTRPDLQTVTALCWRFKLYSENPKEKTVSHTVLNVCGPRTQALRIGEIIGKTVDI